MMQVISQLLHGIGFAPTLQSSYIQGEYPLSLGFKPPPDVSTKRLLALAIGFTPLTILTRVSNPGFGRTEENETEERSCEAVVNDREETLPTRALGGGT